MERRKVFLLFIEHEKKIYMHWNTIKGRIDADTNLEKWIVDYMSNDL